MNVGQSNPLAAASTLYDVVVVGAGPAGSSLASWLAGQGWRVLLLERDRLPCHKVCGEFLSPEAQKSLQAQGLYQTIAALDPVLLSGAKLIGHNGAALELNMPGTAWGISRYRLDAALAAAAEEQGVELCCGTTVTGWQQADGEMVVRLRRRQEPAQSKPDQGEASSVRARAVLVACGRHGLASLLPGSVSRQRHTPGRASSVGIKCHYTHLAMPDQVELYLFAGGYVGINPVEDRRANVCALASYSTFARAGRSPSALIAAAARWNPAFGARLLDAQALPETECAVAPVDTRRRAIPWDGLPLLGDTAAMIAPLVGDGMAMALRSAELCAPLVDGYLRSAFSWSGLGSRYSSLWHREFDQRLRVGRLLETMLQSPRTATLLFRVGANLPSVADYLVRATVHVGPPPNGCLPAIPNGRYHVRASLVAAFRLSPTEDIT